jgi:bacterioferritin-associated ferredoxin
VRRARRRTGARHQPLGRDGGARAARRRHRARQRVRADPLERPDGVGCARRRRGQPGGRSGLGRAGIQAHAGAHRTLRREPGTASSSAAASWRSTGRATGPGSRARLRPLRTGRARPFKAPDWARALLQVDDEDADWIDYEDRAAACTAPCTWSTAASKPACSCRAPGPAGARLAGRPVRQGDAGCGRPRRRCWPAAREKGADPGPTVCSCFGVGRNTICDRDPRADLQDASQVTACVKAGGNCGSCVPEIRALLAATQVAEV